MLENAWIIAVLPLVAWAIITFFNRRLGHRAAYVAITAILISLVLSAVAFIEILTGAAGHEGEAIEGVRRTFQWLTIGNLDITLGFQVDHLTAVMLLVVSIVSSMVQIYSVGYMHGDARYGRYYGVLSIFTFAMLGLVLADNFLLLLFMWEIMGLSSYLLIGHWFENPEPRAASIKAFLTTRVGDVLMMIGIWLLFAVTGTFGFAEIAEKAHSGAIPAAVITLAALGVFGGAVGKSAQFPLHVWLPDAMAGPTPASALIHAATMVAAGVYLVARSYGLFAASPDSLAVVAVIGAVTALMAATIATVMTDMKKVMAYSTISQLGYMMLALGVGGYTAGVFHLVTHAFFKALLFLTAGSVIHAVHSQEMHEMGGLFSKMKVTAWTFLIGAAALAGVPPFSGFWSKDEILLAAYNSHYPALFWMGVVTAGLTAYYVTRMACLVFFGKPRDHHVHDHAHESPAVMTVPLVILATLAAVGGLPGSPLANHWFAEFIRFGEGHEAEAATYVPMLLAIGAAGLGVLVGWLLYGARVVSRAKLIAAFRPVYVLLKNKYFIDEIYNFVFVKGTIALANLVARFDLGVIDWIVNAVGRATVVTSDATGAFDLAVVDGAVNGVAATVVAGSKQVRKIQTGYVQVYVMTLFATVAIGLILIQVIGG